MTDDDKLVLARLEERLKNWMETTTEYRIILCSKIDRLFQRFEELPCKERKEIYRGLAMREKLIWGAIGIIGALVFVHLGWR